MPLVNTIGKANKNLTVTVEAADGSSSVHYNGSSARSIIVPSMERIEALEAAVASAVSTGYLLSPLATDDGEVLCTRDGEMILAGTLTTTG